jgi:hypothetical protein
MSSAFRAVGRLDVIVGNEFARDNVIQAVWKQARRVEDPRRRRRDLVEGAPALGGVGHRPPIAFERRRTAS